MLYLQHTLYYTVLHGTTFIDHGRVNGELGFRAETIVTSFESLGAIQPFQRLPHKPTVGGAEKTTRNT